ncbi:hypothetical protein A7A08_00449 [Methyloligella halotolerans]|uniref:Uncharacterized protein n=1 Tax=Methyloligella halotolerans TaxID=1177755 RepID=A0A1E2S2Q9_9HYPH|nr:hypothetical protein [Methyloligella halotolerans]ODA68618.1 hypothetical protein A7A08_00449 [Methyloligella halotolerans]
MLRILMILSGGFELLFGVSVLVLIAKGVTLSGGATREQATLFAIFTIVLGTAALAVNNRLETSFGIGTAYGLWLYNVIAALILLYLATNTADVLIRSTAAIHTVFGLLFTYALFAAGTVE